MVIVASGMYVKNPVLSSYPINPNFAVVPLCQLKPIPLSLLSSTVNVAPLTPPPIKIIGSTTLVTVLLTCVVVPLTVKLPVTDKLFRTTVLPVVAPIVSEVAARAKFTVVAVASIKLEKIMVPIENSV